MVPPTLNNGDTVARYLRGDGVESATAVAYSLLDVLQPAMDEGEDYYEHWVLTHFLLDGHHKIDAAATAGRPIRMLSLADERRSIASPEDLSTMVAARSHSPQPRS
jgi:hypothetical protein